MIGNKVYTKLKCERKLTAYKIFYEKVKIMFKSILDTLHTLLLLIINHFTPNILVKIIKEENKR